MTNSRSVIPAERIEHSILLLRGHRVILDQDLAALNEVESKALNRAVKRNLDRFPEDFMFQLTAKEFANLRCQIGTSSLRSQFVTSNAYQGSPDAAIESDLRDWWHVK